MRSSGFLTALAVVLTALAVVTTVIASCGRAPGPPAAAPPMAATPSFDATAPLLAVAAPVADTLRRRDPPPAQLADYVARRPKSTIELQPWRESTSAAFTDAGGRSGVATLIDLAPRTGDWLVLRLDYADGASESYHLESRGPERREVVLDPDAPGALILEDDDGRHVCKPFAAEPHALARARATGLPYAPLCGERLYLRNAAEGNKTRLEWTTDLLRDHVWRGEKITVFVREKLYQDAFLESSELIAAGTGAAGRERPTGAPTRARVAPRYADRYLVPAGLGIHLATEVEKRLLVGQWYPARDNPGIFVSAIQPALVAPEVIAELAGGVNPLDEVESGALVYLVAFDLERFDLGYEVGTDHPRLGWSERVPESVRDATLPGPDGIDSAAPLARTGMLSPAAAERVAATFTGGFKRAHGAFKYSALATRSSGSHYGFVEHGAVLSKLQPELATVVVYDDGRVELKTWSAADDVDLPRIRHARQNGVPILEPDPETGVTRVGTLVARWGEGNWSGSQDRRFRTLRAGLCLQESDEGRFLIYGYFSSVTPSAMARVFNAYGCDYAMLLDINALEHTYLALYRQRGGRFLIQHLIDEMSVLDRSAGGQDLPRFVGFADNRDFFYLLRR